MDERRRVRLAEIMEQLAAGDGAAVFWLREEFGRELTGVARTIAARQGAGHLAGDDLADLVGEIVLELAAVAGAWEPRGGATPWRWAERRLTARLAQVIGQHHRPLDEARLGDEPVAVLPAGLDEAPLITLARLAAHDARCALLLDALAVAVSERDADVWLRYRQQQQQGDPSPARTVAGEVGLQPDSVRQIATRGRRRLADVVGADERFAPLTDLALLEPPGTGRSAA